MHRHFANDTPDGLTVLILPVQISFYAQNPEQFCVAQGF